jgi:streptogramin lyase
MNTSNQTLDRFPYLLTKLIIFCAATTIASPAYGQLIGPWEPPPGGAVFTQSGTPNDNSWGRVGGKTFSYSVVVHADRSEKVFWGAETQGVRLSLDGADFSAPGEMLAFDPAQSNFAGGIAAWFGQTTIITRGGRPEIAYTRFRMAFTEQATGSPIALTLASSEGLATDVGGIVPVANSAVAFHVNLSFTASFSPSSGFQPYLDFFDAQTDGSQNGQAHSSLFYGFYFVNTPPFVTVNVTSNVEEGKSVLIDSSHLAAADHESSAEGVRFVVDPDASGATPHNGTLYLSGIPLVAMESFTVADVAASRVSYTHNGSETTQDNFSFSVIDEHDGVANDGGFTVFTHTMSVSPVNDSPTALDGQGTAELSGLFSGTLEGDDPDSAMLQFSIVDVDFGSAQMTDAMAGTFDYTSPLGFVGDADVTFQVFDGEHQAVVPGHFVVTVRDPRVGVLNRGDLLIGNRDLLILHNLPEHTEYVLSSGNQLDTIIAIANAGFDRIYVLDRFNGLLRIDPTNGDQFVIADGTHFTPDTPGSIAIEGENSVLVAEVAGGVMQVDTDTGVVSTLSTGGLLPLPTAVTVDGFGSCYVADASAFMGGSSAIVQIDPISGNQTLISSGPPLSIPFGLTAEANGQLLVADQAENQILRIDPLTGNQSVLASGGDIAAALTDVTASPDGEIYAATDDSGKVVAIDPTTGAQTVVPVTEVVTAPSDVSVFIPDELVFRDSFEDQG